mmetsp:Transcript_1322/g.5676  ORF Transcript_1322/g.5676 Transcript_1322/m.5676 type:complete len:227 (+) Transcript_1322:1574-2254(+)
MPIETRSLIARYFPTNILSKSSRSRRPVSRPRDKSLEFRTLSRRYLASRPWASITFCRKSCAISFANSSTSFSDGRMYSRSFCQALLLPSRPRVRRSCSVASCRYFDFASAAASQRLSKASVFSRCSRSRFCSPRKRADHKLELLLLMPSSLMPVSSCSATSASRPICSTFCVYRRTSVKPRAKVRQWYMPESLFGFRYCPASLTEAHSTRLRATRMETCFLSVLR